MKNKWVLVACLMAATRSWAQNSRFSRNTSAEPIVKDNVTGLFWQGCAAGRTGSACGGTDPTYTWSGALRYCASLNWGGYTDWRLPNVKELSSIVIVGANPAIDTIAFPNTNSSAVFWSSSPLAGGGAAWVVSLMYGRVYYNDTSGSSKGCVRCVRGGL